MKMKAGCSQLKPVVLILIFNSCFYASYQITGLQVCERCSGSVLNGSAVGEFCASSAGRIDGRCCLRKDNTSDPERIIGLDLSNCSLTHLEDLQGASAALIIDLSLNSITNISDTAFQGFTELNYMILPQDIDCPGGNTSWKKVEVKAGNRLCEGQRDMCNQTGQLSLNCPENSLCAPYGPGFFECSCAENYHGYKCLREGEFPALQVFGPLGASTVVISFVLWFTQRRKAKSL
ncbi:LOW QUALITY PROTEIN: all-trans retinoic acid-induced differentiation factor [Plectropomus leopardus]|uniref:LOW QUALITY PROTEIN: all-trans retinoic acid-induced differentiation factor n=1 Tax=Plectropomus leopardus TaxID=160734 RepID=UPI001C4C5D76|nr:LOW QUALITY PROTEIN: all-trans retinoic acid-induced differentiation factor [Plectropomus leopardus]